jgi:hypothetical protein
MNRDMNKLSAANLNLSIAQLIFVAALMIFPVSAALAQGKAEAGATDAKAAEVLLPGAAYDVATIKPTNPNAQGGA